MLATLPLAAGRAWRHCRCYHLVVKAQVVVVVLVDQQAVVVVLVDQQAVVVVLVDHL